MIERILFLAQSRSPFIELDRTLLGKHFDIVSFDWDASSHPARTLVKWMILNRKRFDAIFIWFADAHAYVATLVAPFLGKPSVLQVGGYDVSDVAGYGFLATRSGRRRARSHFSHATCIISVSASLARELHRRYPAARPKTVILPTGVDTDRFQPGGVKTPRVLTVAPVDSWPRALIKGLDRVSEVARAVPDIPFRIVGAPENIARQLRSPGNLEVIGPVPQAMLVPEYQSAAVYLQASRSEGWPNAVMEAMACGCVPVVTNVGGLPELIGDVGFSVGGDIHETAVAVRQALARPDLGGPARARAVERFSLQAREQGLLRIMKAIDGPSKDL
jgi:glycosyltransferase involved in cell wall biosynthesis